MHHQNNITSQLFWSTIAIIIGVFFTAGLKEIATKERSTSFSFQKTSISPTKPKVEIAPAVSAESYIVQSLSTGKILAAQNAEEVLPIASLTKLVTAVVALDLIPNKKIDIIPEDIRVEGNTGRLFSGETLTTKELLYPLLMVSSNDSASAIARSYGTADFVAKMNAWVWSIGAINTAFTDPSGLSFNNVSNTHDMIKIVSWIKKNRPEILDITRLKTKSLKTHTWVNKVHFLNLAEYRGGKNGFTDQAQRTSVSIFSYPEYGKDFNEIAIIILKSSDRTKDVLALLDSVAVR